jgi:predicted regulator of Ras-like GTPase activity (Roadblock/LC7/MglB family)
MSVMSNSLKTRFAGLLRELLRRCDENGSRAVIPQSPRRAAPATPPVATPAYVPPPAPTVQPSIRQPVAPVASKPAAAPAPPAPQKKPTQVENITDLELPLQSVLERLPLELRSKMSAKNVDLSRACLSIALKKIQPQLSLGAVRITFGELRRAAPSLFNVQDEYDSLPVVLPLNEVLARLSPSLLSRNSAQKTVEVPAEITGPFGKQGQVAISAISAKSPKPSTTPSVQMVAPLTTPPAQLRPTPVVMPRQMAPAPGVVSAPHSGNGMGNGTITKPVLPTVSVQPIRTSVQTAASVIPVAMPVSKPTPPVPVTPIVSIAPISMPVSVPTPVVSAQAAMVSLAALSEKWPEALQSEIAPLISANAQVALPANLVESALKRGRVTFTWGNLRSWIKPTPPATSAHDTVELELPLKVVVPHFLSKQSGAMKMARPQRTAPMLADIPDLFFGFSQPQPQPEMPPAPPKATPLPPPVQENRPAPKPVEARQPATNYFTWVKPEPPRTETPAGKIEHKRPATPATGVDSGNHCTTPKEVVSRAAALSGVAGVIVALPDGLTVASQVPSDSSADTLAAFLPQIFDRVNQSTKELRMGTLDNLNFSVGGVPWKIFRVNTVYFAVFGRAGGQLPDAQLTALAAELDSKKQ